MGGGAGVKQICNPGDICFFSVANRDSLFVLSSHVRTRSRSTPHHVNCTSHRIRGSHGVSPSCPLASLAGVTPVVRFKLCTVPASSCLAAMAAHNHSASAQPAYHYWNGASCGVLYIRCTAGRIRLRPASIWRAVQYPCSTTRRMAACTYCCGLHSYVRVGIHVA